MTRYRIRKSPSGKWYRIQYQKQTLRSLFLRVFLPDYPRQWRWVWARSSEGGVIQRSSEELIRECVKELRQLDMDSIEEDWSILEA
jgi:hypothetical protein